MDDKQRFTNVLDKQIKELEDEILKNKIDIADTFVRIDSSANSGEVIPKDISRTFKDMRCLRMHTDTLRQNEAKLEALTKSRVDIDREFLNELVKV